MGSKEEAPHPVGLPNPRLRPCCELHRAEGRVSNFCYQNAVFQCLASLPWARSMVPKTGRLQEEFWELLEVLVSEDEDRAFTRVPDFIVGFGVRVDEQFMSGLFRNCHQQVCLAQCDAGEFFLRFLDKLYGDLDELSPFNFSMDVQHFETRDIGYRQMDSKHVMSATESHSCLIVEPVSPELNACIAASYDERNIVHEKRPGRFFSKTVEVVKSKQASVVLPGPKFLAIYIKRVRGVQRRGYRSIQNEKDERSISIPLRDFQLEGKPSLNYHCCGVVCHAGQSVDAGHYVAYVRRGTNWFFCDDDHIVMLHPNQFGARNIFEPAGDEHHVPCIVFFESAVASERSSSPLPDALHKTKALAANELTTAIRDDPDQRPSTASAASPNQLNPRGRPSPPSRAQPCASCARKNQTINFLREQVAQLQQKLQEAKNSSLNEIRAATAKKEASLATLQKHFQESVENQETLHNQIRALRQECSEKDSVIETLRSQVARADQDLSNAASTSQDVRRLEQCLMVEKKRCLATTEQMKTTIRDLQQQLREAHVDESYLRRDLTDSRRQAEALSRSVTDLKLENTSLREQILRERQAWHLRAGASSIRSAPRPATAQLRTTRRYSPSYPY